MNQVIKKKARLSINGVLLLDKPAGWSSNDALIKAKRLLNAIKAGHTGTLDPFATGLLPLCFGEATKFSADLLDADKTYQTVVHLGVVSNTGDTEGELIQTCEANVTVAQIRAVLEQFKGDILQVPPMYSALKRDGKPLYEYARQGVTLERDARPVTIHQLEFVKYEAPFLTLNVRCSKGTYIRVLGEDIGKALGCGAHLNALRRTQVGHLRLENTLTLDQLIAMSEERRYSLLAPVDALLSSFPEVVLSEELSRRFLQGQRISLAKEGVTHPSQLGRVRVYRIDNDTSIRQLLGSAQLQEFSVLAPERLISTAH